MEKSLVRLSESAQASATVFAVALDDLTAERLRLAVRNTNLTVAIVSMEEAVNRARTTDTPSIFLVEWNSGQEARTAEVCSAIRGVCSSDRCYILALGGVGDTSNLFRALNGSADAVLSRPFGSESLIVKLRHAVQSMRAIRAHASSIQSAVKEALDSSGGGEVVVRSDSAVAQIHVQGGHIVWANVSSMPATMEEVLNCGGVVLESGMAQAVRDECRTTGAHFIEVLVQWGMVEREIAREAVRSFVAGRLKAILELPNAVALFLPKSRPHNERLRFKVEEITSLGNVAGEAPDSGAALVHVPTAPRTNLSLPPSAGPLNAAEARCLEVVLNGAMGVDGAVSAEIIDRRTGEMLLHAGAEVDLELVGSLVSTLVRLGQRAEEVMAAAGDQLLMARPLKAKPSCILFMTLSATHVSLGLAKALLSRVANGDLEAPRS